MCVSEMHIGALSEDNFRGRRVVEIGLSGILRLMVPDDLVFDRDAVLSSLSILVTV